MNPTTKSLNVCAYCQREERGHQGRWTLSEGWHHYAAPTDALRLWRLKSRRAQSAA
jgi:hypothetical protein